MVNLGVISSPRIIVFGDPRLSLPIRRAITRKITEE